MQKTRTKKPFWECLKPMNDTRKDKDDIPSILEDNWLTYFRSLYSKNPSGPIQQSIIDDINLLELQKEQFPYLDYLINYNNNNNNNLYSCPRNYIL